MPQRLAHNRLDIQSSSCYRRRTHAPRRATFLIVLAGRAGAARPASATSVLTRTTRDWFEDDLALRSRAGGRRARNGSLSTHWTRATGARSRDVLDATSRATSASWAPRPARRDGELLAATDGLPDRVLAAARVLGAHARRGAGATLVVDDAGAARRAACTSASTPLDDGEQPLGVVVLRARPELRRAARGDDAQLPARRVLRARAAAPR